MKNKFPEEWSLEVLVVLDRLFSKNRYCKECGQALSKYYRGVACQSCSEQLNAYLKTGRLLKQ